jgi:poly(hydroxyalkanoate) granule-associated protein
MVSKHIKSKRVTRPAAPNEAARKFWLAGLGAVALAQKQSNKIVETLVEEGEQFKARSEKYVNTVARDVRRAVGDVRKQAKGLVTPIRKRAVAGVKQFEGALSNRLGHFLGRFGVPSKHDIEELSSRVGALNQKVRTRTRKRAA